MRLVPVDFASARRFIREYHRHNPAVVGWKFGVGLADDSGVLVGVAVAGRPVARMMDDGQTIEVNRVCTDGTRNACSMLYGAIARAARALGYRRVVTYTLKSESGASLRGAGWRVLYEVPARSWAEASVARPRTDRHVVAERLLWESFPPPPGDG